MGLSCSLSLSVMQRAMCFRCSWGAETLWIAEAPWEGQLPWRVSCIVEDFVWTISQLLWVGRQSSLAAYSEQYRACGEKTYVLVLVAFLTRCTLLSSQTTAEHPTSLVFFLYPKPRVAAVWRVAAVGNEGGKCLLPFPSESVLSHKWFTYWWSPQMPSMCSQVLSLSMCRPISMHRQEPRTPHRARVHYNTSGSTESSLEMSRPDVRHPHTQLLQNRCSHKQRESAELFPGKRWWMWFGLFFFTQSMKIVYFKWLRKG